MRASPLIASALALALGASSAQAQAEGVAEAFAEGRYDLALEAADGLSDPVLAAEWRFQVLHSSGDLSGALAAARAGLVLAPAHPRLTQNAANVALTLGEGALALQFCEGWQRALEATADEGQRSAGFERLARYRANANELLALDAAARTATERARAAALVLLAAALLALWRLARPAAASDPR